MQKPTQLRNMLSSDRTEFILEAHNGLSARIVEETGFKGIWGSGLALSAQHAVRDNNELSWTQVVEQLEFMTDVTSIPILLDGDTGYGDFNNMRRLVRKLCPHCKSVTHLEVEQINGFAINPDDDIYKANGCSECLQTGFRGRTGIYEIIEVDDKLATMIHDGSSQPELEKYCRTRSQSLRDDGVRKVLQGETTIDEVLRVTRDGG